MAGRTMRFAPEGKWFIIGAWAIALLLAALGSWIPLVVWLPLAIWVLVFFRDPERRWALGSEVLLAPADGKGVSVGDGDEPPFLGTTATRVSIFMNAFDCHVNPHPTDGTRAY